MQMGTMTYSPENKAISAKEGQTVLLPSLTTSPRSKDKVVGKIMIYFILYVVEFFPQKVRLVTNSTSRTLAGRGVILTITKGQIYFCSTCPTNCVGFIQILVQFSEC